MFPPSPSPPMILPDETVPLIAKIWPSSRIFILSAEKEISPPFPVPKVVVMIFPPLLISESLLMRMSIPPPSSLKVIDVTDDSSLTTNFPPRIQILPDLLLLTSMTDPPVSDISPCSSKAEISGSASAGTSPRDATLAIFTCPPDARR